MKGIFNNIQKFVKYKRSCSSVIDESMDL